MSSYNEKRRIKQLDAMPRTGKTIYGDNDVYENDSIDLLIVNAERAKKWYMPVDLDRDDGEYEQGTKRIPMDRIALLNESRLVPSNFLPSYIDEIIQGTMKVKYSTDTPPKVSEWRFVSTEKLSPIGDTTEGGVMRTLFSSVNTSIPDNKYGEIFTTYESMLSYVGNATAKYYYKDMNGEYVETEAKQYDLIIVNSDSTHSNNSTRYYYTGNRSDAGTTHGWKYNDTVGDGSLSQAEISALVAESNKHEYREYVAPWTQAMEDEHAVWEFAPETDKIYVDIDFTDNAEADDESSASTVDGMDKDYYQYRYIKGTVPFDGNDRFSQVPNVMVMEDGLGTVKRRWGDGSDNRIYKIDLNIAPDHPFTTDNTEGSSSNPKNPDTWERMIGVDTTSTDANLSNKLYHFTTGIVNSRVGSGLESNYSNSKTSTNSFYIAAIDQQSIIPEQVTRSSYINTERMTSSRFTDYSVITQKTTLKSIDTVAMDFGSHFWVPRIKVNKSGHVMDIDLWDMILPNTAAYTKDGVYHRGLVQIGTETTHLADNTSNGTMLPYEDSNSGKTRSPDEFSTNSFVKVAASNHTHGSSALTLGSSNRASTGRSRVYKPFDTADARISGTELLNIQGLDADDAKTALIIGTTGNSATANSYAVVRNTTNGTETSTFSASDFKKVAIENTHTVRVSTVSQGGSSTPTFVSLQVPAGATGNSSISQVVLSDNGSSAEVIASRQATANQHQTNLYSLYGTAGKVSLLQSTHDDTNAWTDTMFGDNLANISNRVSVAIPGTATAARLTANGNTVANQVILPNNAYNTVANHSSHDILTVAQNGQMNWTSIKEWLGITPHTLDSYKETSYGIAASSMHGVPFFTEDSTDTTNAKMTISDSVFIDESSSSLGIRSMVVPTHDDEIISASTIAMSVDNYADKTDNRRNFGNTIRDLSYISNERYSHTVYFNERNNNTPTASSSLIVAQHYASLNNSKASEYYDFTIGSMWRSNILPFVRNASSGEIASTLNLYSGAWTGNSNYSNSSFSIHHNSRTDSYCLNLNTPHTTKPSSKYIMYASSVSGSTAQMEWASINKISQPDFLIYNSAVTNVSSVASVIKSGTTINKCVAVKFGNAPVENLISNGTTIRNYENTAKLYRADITIDVNASVTSNTAFQSKLITGYFGYQRGETIGAKSNNPVVPFTADMTREHNIIHASFIIPKASSTNDLTFMLTVELETDSYETISSSTDWPDIKIYTRQYNITQVT